MNQYMTPRERKAVHTPTPYAASELTQHEYDLLVRDAMRWRTRGDELVAACKAVAGVFEDSEDQPLYARKCIAALAKVSP